MREHANITSAARLIESADNFGTAYREFVEFSTDVVHATEPHRPRGAGSLVLVLQEELGLDEISEFLATLSSIYLRLATLAGLQEGDRRLEVRKIETGSLLVDLLGNEALVGVVVALVSGAFGWGYRRYTAEGRLKTFPDAISAVEKTLQLRDRLTAAGFSVSHLDASIQQAEKETASGLTKLFARRHHIQVNNYIFTRTEPSWHPTGSLLLPQLPDEELPLKLPPS